LSAEQATQTLLADAAAFQNMCYCKHFSLSALNCMLLFSNTPTCMIIIHGQFLPSQTALMEPLRRTVLIYLLNAAHVLHALDVQLQTFMSKHSAGTQGEVAMLQPPGTAAAISLSGLSQSMSVTMPVAPSDISPSSSSSLPPDRRTRGCWHNVLPAVRQAWR